MTETVFQRPPYSLLPDPKGVRMYANVSNRMEIARGDRAHHVAVAVPTGLFSFLREVVKAPIDEVFYLAMDEVGDRYFLSLVSESEDRIYDLCSYSKGSVPAWIFASEYRLR